MLLIDVDTCGVVLVQVWHGFKLNINILLQKGIVFFPKKLKLYFTDLSFNDLN